MSGRSNLPLDEELEPCCADCGTPWRSGEIAVYRGGRLHHLGCEPEVRERQQEAFVEELSRRASTSELREDARRLAQQLGSGRRWNRESRRVWQAFAERRVVGLAGPGTPNDRPHDEAPVAQVGSRRGAPTTPPDGAGARPALRDRSRKGMLGPCYMSSRSTWRPEATGRGY